MSQLSASFLLCFLFLFHMLWISGSTLFVVFCCGTAIVPLFPYGFFRFLYHRSNQNGLAWWPLCLCFLFHALWVSGSVFGIFGFCSLCCLYCLCLSLRLLTLTCDSLRCWAFSDCWKSSHCLYRIFVVSR